MLSAENPQDYQQLLLFIGQVMSVNIFLICNTLHSVEFVQKYSYNIIIMCQSLQLSGSQTRLQNIGALSGIEFTENQT